MLPKVDDYFRKKWDAYRIQIYEFFWYDKVIHKKIINRLQWSSLLVVFSFRKIVNIQMRKCKWTIQLLRKSKAVQILRGQILKTNSSKIYQGTNAMIKFKSLSSFGPNFWAQIKSCRMHKEVFQIGKFYFPVTLSEAPSLKNSEDGFRSFSGTKAPDFIGADVIQ